MNKNIILYSTIYVNRPQERSCWAAKVALFSVINGISGFEHILEVEVTERSECFKVPTDKLRGELT